VPLQYLCLSLKKGAWKMGNIKSKKLTVLLVDDEDRFREALSRQLSVRGFNVLSAANGEDAVKMVHNNAIDVTILDQKMPGMGGTQTFNEIKKIDPLIEIIMLTGQATVDDALEIMKQGAFDYIMKPMTIDELLFKIEDAYTRKVLMEKKNQKK
jgi:two-component system, response regulator RegA